MTSLTTNLDSFKNTVLALNKYAPSSSDKKRQVKAAALRALAEIGKPFVLDHETVLSILLNINQIQRHYNTLKIVGVFKKFLFPSKTSSSISAVLTGFHKQCRAYLAKDDNAKKMQVYCLENKGLGSLLELFHSDLLISDYEFKKYLAANGCSSTSYPKIEETFKENKELFSSRAISVSEYDIHKQPGAQILIKLLKSLSSPMEVRFVLSEIEKYVSFHLEKISTSGHVTKEAIASILKPRPGLSRFESLILGLMDEKKSNFSSFTVKSGIFEFLLNVLGNLPPTFHLTDLEKHLLPKYLESWSDRDLTLGICGGRATLAMATSIEHASEDERKVRFLQSQFVLAHKQNIERISLLEGKRLLPEINRENFDKIDPPLLKKWALLLGFEKPETEDPLEKEDYERADIEKLFSALSSEISKERIESYLRILGSLSQKNSKLPSDSKAAITLEEDLSKLHKTLHLSKKTSEAFVLNEFYALPLLLLESDKAFEAKIRLIAPGIISHALSVHYFPKTETSEAKYLLLDPNNRDELTGHPKAKEFSDPDSLYMYVKLLAKVSYKACKFTEMVIELYDKTPYTVKELEMLFEKMQSIAPDLARTFIEKARTTEVPAELFIEAQTALKKNLSEMDPAARKTIERSITALYGIDATTVFAYPLQNIDILVTAQKKSVDKFEFDPDELVRLSEISKAGAAFDKLFKLSRRVAKIESSLIDPMLQAHREGKSIEELRDILGKSLRRHLEETIVDLFPNLMSLHGVSEESFKSTPLEFIDEALDVFNRNNLTDWFRGLGSFSTSIFAT